MKTIITPISKLTGLTIKHDKTTLTIDPPHNNHQSTITLLTHPHKDHTPQKTTTKTLTHPKATKILSLINMQTKPIKKETEINKITITPITITHTTFTYNYLVETPSSRILIAYDWEEPNELTGLDPDVIITDCMYSSLNTTKIKQVKTIIKQLLKEKNKIKLTLTSPIDLVLIQELSELNPKIPNHDPITNYTKLFPEIKTNKTQNNPKLIIKSIKTVSENTIDIKSLKLGHPTIQDIITLAEESKPKTIILHHSTPPQSKHAEKKLKNELPDINITNWVTKPTQVKT